MGRSFRHTETTWTYEERPSTQTVGRVALGCVVLTSSLALGYVLTRGQLLLVLAVLCACGAAFPIALWFSLRRSFFSVRFDFAEQTIEVVKVASFDPTQVFYASFLDFDAEASGSSLVVRWHEDPTTVLTVPTESESFALDLANRVRSRLRD